MADDKKISDLTAAGALSGVELVEIVQGGVNKQTTTQDIANLAGGGGTWGSITGTLSSQTDLQSALDAKAPLASPTFTGTPAAPTAAAATNTTQVATTAFVQQEIGSKVDEETFATLTFASPTVWNNNSRQSPLAKVTATGDFTLDMTNVKSGAQGVLIVTASTASAFTLTFDTDFTNTEISTGASLLTYTFPADNGQVYYLFYVCDGTSLAWTIVDLQATDPTPFAQIARSTAQSINNNDTSVPVTFATEVHDNAAIWASSPNPTRFVIPGSGDKIATVSIRAQWAVNSTGMRRNIPYLNGSTTGDIGQAGAIASTATILNTTHQIACAGGDYIEIVCYQNSGGALDLDVCQVRISIQDR